MISSTRTQNRAKSLVASTLHNPGPSSHRATRHPHFPDADKSDLARQYGFAGRSPSVAAASVELCRECSDGFDAWFGVSGQGARVLVPALGLEQDGGDAFLAEVSQCRVSELVER